MNHPPEKKSLSLRQAWFLGVMALAVVSMFSFVILPYVDPKPAKLSGEQAQDFDLELISGGAPGDRVRLSDFLGKTVVLDFWASWCKPCREQSAVLAKVATQLPDSVYLLGVATSDERPAAVTFAQASPDAYPNAFDEGGVVATAFRVSTLPTIVIVGPDGIIRSTNSRTFTETELLSLITSVGR